MQEPDPRVKIQVEQEMEENLTTPGTEKPEEFPEFSWNWFDSELLRGPGLSFPVTVNIKIGPRFGLLVMAAVKSFREAYGSAFIDPEEDLTSSIGNNVCMAEENDVIELNEHDMALELTYIDGATRLLVLHLQVENIPTSH